MSSVSDAGSDGAWRRRGSCGAKWTPVELLAMVLGFMVYWPIGLGLIAWKLLQRRKAFDGPAGEDWLGALRDKFNDVSARGFGGQGFGPAADGSGAPSGNAAFDEWRRHEIERLDEERRKLDKARADFAAFVDEARKSKDREEFERFMGRRPQG